jgi:PDZ domain
MHGGAADRSGLIHVGDEVLEVNNINVEGKTPADVLTILVSANSFACDSIVIVGSSSKTPTGSSRSSWFRLMEKWVNARAKFG